MSSWDRLPHDEEGFVDMSAFEDLDPDEALAPDELTTLHETLLSAAEEHLDEPDWDDLVHRVVEEPQPSLDEPDEALAMYAIAGVDVVGLSDEEMVALRKALFPEDDNPFDDYSDPNPFEDETP